MAKQQERSESTKSQLLKAFRTSFLKRGFEETTTQYVLEKTGLSKGAMYHHFRSKIEIVEALYADETRRAITRALQSVDKNASPLVQLKGAYLAWMQEVRAPNVSKVLFEIGPSALGPQKAKDIEDSISLKHIEAFLEQAIAAGDLAAHDPKLIAAFLNALVAEAALYSLRTGNDPIDALSQAIDGMLNGLRP